MSGSSELKVGLFALAAIAAAIYASMATTDNPFEDKGYHLVAMLPSAQGLKPDSPFEMVGVRIGAVSSIDVVGDRARVTIAVDPGTRLPYDSRVEVATRGILGDTVLKVQAGTSDTLLSDGDYIEARPPAPTLGELQGQLGVIAQDIQAITGSLRAIIGSSDTQQAVASILTNVDMFTGQLTDIAAGNQAEIREIVMNIRSLTEELNRIAVDLRPEVKDEIDALQEATDTLQQGLVRVESIARKIDDGEGTLGRLVNDAELIDGIEETVADVSELVRGISRFQLELDYHAEAMVSHGPGGTTFAGVKNIGRVRVKPRPDYWYEVEVIDDPAGDLDLESQFVTGDVESETTKITRTQDMQFSFQVARRFRAVILRLGIKESSGGFGADLMLANDRIAIHADVFDFRWGGWPRRLGVPNVKLGIDLSPIDHIYFTAGFDNLVNGIIDRRLTWYVGAGFYFTDNDLKWVLGSLPAGAL